MLSPSPLARSFGRASPELGERPSFYLYPGHLFASREPHAVITILRSCVAVCLWDPQLGSGGVNHFLLPVRAKDLSASPRFGDAATHSLIRQLLAFGSSTGHLEAKLFGGAHMLGITSRTGGHLGADNVEIAREVLAEYAIPVVAEDVGGSKGRKLIFFTDTGLAQVRRL
jgi:chemotaxis protein CheD